ncbi:MAG: Gfo/Idh/MocA family oxidoreductase [Planctomycetaceae bacterium]|nr:Gfo/Idh/MocA family oxidoreductase [Planctomycetaceae bacterium]
MSRKRVVTRREFVGAAAAGFLIVPRRVVARSGQTPPSEKLRIAGIGVGGQGRGDLYNVSGEDIVALCDVDRGSHTAKSFEQWSKARQFRDFRRMFDDMEQQIDAVVVATPDHTHAVAAMAAIKRGKHVYCEKPLAHSVHEVRQLMKAAQEHQVVTQLGNQGHSSDSIRTFCEWIWDGAIGTVSEIHAGCSHVNSGGGRRKSVPGAAVPTTLDWDLWLGPAQWRAYDPAYAPGTWRGWVPFGNGTIGDWACHVLDPVFWALDLGAPQSIQARVKDYDPQTQSDLYPPGDVITFEFPAKGQRGPVTLHWYSGTEPIPRPPQLEEDQEIGPAGAVVYGDKGSIIYGSHGAGGVRIFPQEQMQAYQRPAPSIPRVADGNHHRDWLDAIRHGRSAGSDFSYGGPLTELALLGVVAIKMAGTRLEYDAQQMKFPNCPEADQYLAPPYRDGWTL